MDELIVALCVLVAVHSGVIVYLCLERDRMCKMLRELN